MRKERERGDGVCGSPTKQNKKRVRDERRGRGRALLAKQQQQQCQQQQQQQSCGSGPERVSQKGTSTQQTKNNKGKERNDLQ